MISFGVLDKIFAKMDRFYIFLFSVLLTGAIGVIDYITGYEIGFYVFYLIPVSFAVWYGDYAIGVMISFLSALVWAGIDISSRGQYPVSIILWNASIRLVTFLLVCHGLWYIKNKRNKERDLLDFVVHDLRSPLTAVKESLDLVKELAANKLNEDEHGALAAGQTSCRRALTLINSILALSRLEAGKMPIDSDDIAVAELARAAMREVSIFARRSHIILEEKIKSDVMNIESDKNLLFRILINLLSNAIKVSSQNSTVTLSVISSDPRFITFSIEDQGPGIPSHAQHIIFDKFGQLESRKQEGAFGSGIGLSFVKLATESLGGSVVIASAEKKGTQISVNIPVKMNSELI